MRETIYLTIEAPPDKLVISGPTRLFERFIILLASSLRDAPEAAPVGIPPAREASAAHAR